MEQPPTPFEFALDIDKTNTLDRHSLSIQLNHSIERNQLGDCNKKVQQWNKQNNKNCMGFLPWDTWHVSVLSIDVYSAHYRFFSFSGFGTWRMPSTKAAARTWEVYRQGDCDTSKTKAYTPSEAWSGVNWANLMAAQNYRSGRPVPQAPWAAMRSARFTPLQASDRV